MIYEDVNIQNMLYGQNCESQYFRGKKCLPVVGFFDIAQELKCVASSLFIMQLYYKGLFLWAFIFMFLLLIVGICILLYCLTSDTCISMIKNISIISIN